jgi:hypothetical protein
MVANTQECEAENAAVLSLMGLSKHASIRRTIGAKLKLTHYRLFGTILGIVNSFQGVEGDRTSVMAAIVERLSESLWPTAFGLLVGLVSLWFYLYLAGRLRAFDREMENASLDLLNQLSRFPGRFTTESAINRMSDDRMFGEKSLEELN